MPLHIRIASPLGKPSTRREQWGQYQTGAVPPPLIRPTSFSCTGSPWGRCPARRLSPRRVLRHCRDTRRSSSLSHPLMLAGLTCPAVAVGDVSVDSLAVEDYGTLGTSSAPVGVCLSRPRRGLAVDDEVGIPVYVSHGTGLVSLAQQDMLLLRCLILVGMCEERRTLSVDDDCIESCHSDPLPTGMGGVLFHESVQASMTVLPS